MSVSSYAGIVSSTPTRLGNWEITFINGSCKLSFFGSDKKGHKWIIINDIASPYNVKVESIASNYVEAMTLFTLTGASFISAIYRYRYGKDFLNMHITATKDECNYFAEVLKI